VNQLLKANWERLQSTWQQLEPKQKKNLIAVGIIAVLILTGLVWYSLNPQYVVVYQNLDDKAAGEVVTQLQQMKIPYRLDGTTISVPRAQADQVRVSLAMQGLPHTGTIGYDVLLNQSNLAGMSDNQFNVENLIALEGSIANTIRSIDGIDNAQVHIVMPEQQLFVQQNQQDAKASVFLQVHPGTRLNPPQVMGIQSLVAHSVPGLQVDNVSVVDQYGERLDQTADAGGDNTAINSDAMRELQIKKAYEQQMAQQVLDAIQRITGPGNADVIVNANLNFDKVKTTSNEVKPVTGGHGLVVSEQDTSESSTGGGAPPSGVTGTTSNGGTGNGAPSYLTSSASNGSYQMTQKTVNYDNTKVLTETQSQPFTVQDLTVSVLLNGQPNPQRENMIRQVVATAVGYQNNGAANSKITVASMPFQVQNPFSGNRGGIFSNPLYAGGAAVGVLLLAVGAYFLLRRRKTQIEMAPLVKTIDDLYAKAPETEEQRRRQELEKLARQRPEEFANLLRSWLVED
jgi:flagellar M-ring protein FliF